MNFIIFVLGKAISRFSKTLSLGHGSTWPGHIALKLNPKFISDAFKNSKAKVILVTGTNGKTTTSKLLQIILEKNGKKTFLNVSGANLLNGIASSIILNSSFMGKINADFAIFEVDENTLPLITKKIEPDFIIGLNLFRDQLDRYGELDSIAKKWQETYKDLNHTTFILNADDPKIAYLGNSVKKVYYFGLNDKTLEIKEKQYASDSITCPKCGSKLSFSAYFFSHLGIWECPHCRLKRPKILLSDFSYYPLLGTYAKYDTLAAVLTTKVIGVRNATIESALKLFKPAFGRQEQLIMNKKNVQLFLSKNPTSFNESLRTINENHAKNLLIVLNDRIPDGTDVSWIWDIDFETLLSKKSLLYLAGDRVYELVLRLKYAGIDIQERNIFENLSLAIDSGLKETKATEIFYILPTYSAMLETRKILTGKRIL